MDFTFVLRSDEDVEDLKYYLELLDWQPDHLSVLVNFTDPTIVSKGLVSDYVKIKIKNKDLFATETGRVLENDHIEIMDLFPRQLPKGVEA